MSNVAETAGSRVRGRTSARRWAAFFGIAAAVVIADQLTKAWVAASFTEASAFLPPGTPNGPTEVIDGFVRIAMSHNSGGIFGIFGASAVLLGLASLVVIGFIVWYHGHPGDYAPLLLTIVLGLLLGGAIGNDLDRFRLGYVIDWVDMGIGNNRWYTFNVADAAISCAIVGLLILGFLGERRART